MHSLDNIARQPALGTHRGTGSGIFTLPGLDQMSVVDGVGEHVLAAAASAGGTDDWQPSTHGGVDLDDAR